jgi:hypothetical protein
VTLDADPERTVTIPIATTGQGGVSDVDYSGVPSEVTFDSGETERTFAFITVERPRRRSRSARRRILRTTTVRASV